MKRRSLSPVWVVRGVRYPILLAIGSCLLLSGAVRAQESIVVGNLLLGGVDYSRAEVEAVLLVPPAEFTSCWISLRVCTVNVSVAGALELGNCYMQEILLDTADLMGPMLKLSKTVNMETALQDLLRDPQHTLFFGFQIESSDPCAPDVSPEDPADSSQYVLSGTVKIEEELSMETLMVNVWGIADDPCASVHIRVRGHPL